MENNFYFFIINFNDEQFKVYGFLWDEEEKKEGLRRNPGKKIG